MEYSLTFVKILTCQEQMTKLNLSELADDITCSYGHKLEIQTGHYKNISAGRVVQHWKGLSGKAGESVLGCLQDLTKVTADLSTSTGGSRASRNWLELMTFTSLFQPMFLWLCTCQ